MRSPILFLVFNRPDTTLRVFEMIRAARPPKLYIAADGPRAGKPAEAKLCAAVREIAEAVDWPCKVKTLFRTQNLGCKIGVSTGISWFFAEEPEGIILEDDVLPIPTFFEFCDEMLEKFRDDDRICMISGSNLISSHFHSKDSYFFSRYPYIWGWAGWRRSWGHYDVNMSEWPRWRDSGGLARMSGGNRLVSNYWRRVLNSTYDGKINTWDYQWFFACWRTAGLAVLPALNQTQNLGYGADATHTTSEAPDFVTESPTQPLEFPLVHPREVEPDVQADSLILSKVFGISLKRVVKLYLLGVPVVARWASRRADRIASRRASSHT